MIVAKFPISSIRYSISASFLLPVVQFLLSFPVFCTSQNNYPILLPYSLSNSVPCAFPFSQPYTSLSFPLFPSLSQPSLSISLSLRNSLSFLSFSQKMQPIIQYRFWLYHYSLLFVLLLFFSHIFLSQRIFSLSIFSLSLTHSLSFILSQHISTQKNVDHW